MSALRAGAVQVRNIMTSAVRSSGIPGGIPTSVSFLAFPCLKLRRTWTTGSGSVLSIFVEIILACS